MKLEKLLRCSLIAIVVVASALATAHRRSYAAGLPERPITMLVGLAPRNATDAVARMLAAEMSGRLEIPAVVDNRPGANEIVTIKTWLHSSPDGYTLLMGTGSSLAQSPAIRKGLGYNPRADMTPVGLVAKAVGVLSVAPDAPIRTLAEAVALAKANPEGLAYGSSGVGMASHLPVELLMHS